MKDNNHKSYCKYKGVHGECNDYALAGGSFCFWHEAKIDKSKINIIEKLEKRAKTGIPMEGFILCKTNLQGINLHIGNKPCTLINSDLSRADLTGAHLYGVDLSGSNFLKANFTNANLNQTNLSGCNLLRSIFKNTRVEFINWGKCLQQELLIKTRHKPSKDLYREAEETARMLKKYLDSEQMHSASRYFFYKEMRMQRKQMKYMSLSRGFSWLVDFIIGYGEYPHRLLFFVFGFIVIFAGIFFYLGVNDAHNMISYNHNANVISNIHNFLTCLYFSIVTFTTLGYGDITPYGLSRVFACIEVIVGNLSLGLFVVLCLGKITK